MRETKAHKWRDQSKKNAGKDWIKKKDLSHEGKESS